MMRFIVLFLVCLPQVTSAFAKLCWDPYTSDADNLATCQELAKAGDPQAQFSLGDIYFKGSRDIAKDYGKAAEYLAAAASQRWLRQLDAQLELGQLYSDIDSPIRNYEAAIHWYSLAAAAGSLEGQMGLADVYFYQRGQHQDLIKGYMWYLIAQMNGSSFKLSRTASQLTREQRLKAMRLADDWITAHPCTLSASPGKCEVEN